MFKRMEISEAIYEGGVTSKNTSQAESDRVSHDINKKGVAFTSPSTLGRSELEIAIEAMQDI